MARDHAALMAELQALTEDLRAYRDTLAQRPLAHRYEDTLPPETVVGDDAGWVPRRAARARHPVRPVGAGLSHPVAGLLPDVADTAEDVLASPQPDWLFHVLSVSGPSDELSRFREGAAGPGIIPWSDDRLIVEDLVDHLVLHDPWPGARQEAQGVVDRVMALCRPATGRVALDLQALVPVPETVLALGAQDPVARSWLWAHWGTTLPLRQVLPVASKPAVGPDSWVVSFWSADWTPWRALAQVQRNWPLLSFSIRPTYDAG